MDSAEAGPVGSVSQADARHDAHDSGAADVPPTTELEQPRTEATSEVAPEAAPMSKNALKRLRRQQRWEEGREARRQQRREKRVDQRQRQRAQKAALVAEGGDPAAVMTRRKLLQRQRAGATVVPVAIVVDCNFEAYMTDKELISLTSQATRCYSDNRNARHRSHLLMAGWAGKIYDRFHTVLGDQHRYWKGVGFVPGDFLAAADEARRRMAERPGDMIEALRGDRGEGTADGASSSSAWIRDAPGDEPYPLPGPEPAIDEAHGDVVYLTSESPYTLQRLEAHTTYVVGGLVDKNREKGLCYRRARERGIRTARLPIGQFMVMQSRQVLATNHVVSIMLKWLECEDWGQAFLAVIPKRKGGRLIGDDAEAEAEAEDGDEENEAADASVMDGVDEVVESAVTGEVKDEAQPEAQAVEAS